MAYAVSPASLAVRVPAGSTDDDACFAGACFARAFFAGFVAGAGFVVFAVALPAVFAEGEVVAKVFFATPLLPEAEANELFLATVFASFAADLCRAAPFAAGAADLPATTLLAAALLVIVLFVPADAAFCLAHRARWAAAMRSRPAALIVRRLGGISEERRRFDDPFGRPRPRFGAISAEAASDCFSRDVPELPRPRGISLLWLSKSRICLRREISESRAERISVVFMVISRILERWLKESEKYKEALTACFVERG